MEEIKRSTINNNRIPTAVMTRVIPTVNELIAEIRRLQHRVDVLEGKDEASDPDGEEEGIDPTASVAEAFDDEIARPLLEAGYATVGAVNEASDEDLIEVDGIAEARLKEIRETLS